MASTEEFRQVLYFIYMHFSIMAFAHSSRTITVICLLFLLTANNIQMNPGPFSDSIKILSFNARSIVNKQLHLQMHVSLVNPDIVAITETWFHNGVNDGEIFPDSYITHHQGGGVLLAIKSTFHCFHRCDLETKCELLWCEIPVCSSTSYFLGVFYRPPNSDIKYLEELYKSLEKVHSLSERVKIILTGDFNFPDIDWNLTALFQPNSLSDYFCDAIMNYFCLTQSIDMPTRGDAILNLLVSNCPKNLLDIDVCDSLGSSDHNIVNFILARKLSRPYQAPKLVTTTKMQIGRAFAMIYQVPHGTLF